MARVRSFSAPHKGLRSIISKFSFFLGHTDFENPEQLAELKQLGSEMLVLLNDHVHTENEHTLRHLEERVPGASDHDKDDHEKLEMIQLSLENRLLRFTGKESPDEIHAFYLDFSLFQSQYLQHTFEEETVTEMLLHQHFTDEELIQHRIDIMQRIKFPVLLLWLKYIIPAQQESENVDMLSGFKANAPKEAFEQVLSAFRNEMSADRYQSLVDRLK